MKILTDYQIMSLYLLCFQLTEDTELQEQQTLELIDQILTEQGYPKYDDTLIDNEGAPLNAGEKIKEEFYNWYDGRPEEYSDFQIILLEAIISKPVTRDYLLTLLTLLVTIG